MKILTIIGVIISITNILALLLRNFDVDDKGRLSLTFATAIASMVYVIIITITNLT